MKAIGTRPKYNRNTKRNPIIDRGKIWENKFFRQRVRNVGICINLNGIPFGRKLDMSNPEIISNVGKIQSHWSSVKDFYS